MVIHAMHKHNFGLAFYKVYAMGYKTYSVSKHIVSSKHIIVSRTIRKNMSVNCKKRQKKKKTDLFGKN